MKNSRKNGGINIPERVYLLAPEDLMGNASIELTIGKRHFAKIYSSADQIVKESNENLEIRKKKECLILTISELHKYTVSQERAFSFMILEELQGLRLICELIKVETLADKKLKVVQSFIQSGDAEYVLNRCPELWVKINDYYDLLQDFVTKKEILKDVRINLRDPFLSKREKPGLESLEAELVKYIESLDKRIKDIEKQILDIIQNNPNCIP